MPARDVMLPPRLRRAPKAETTREEIPSDKQEDPGEVKEATTDGIQVTAAVVKEEDNAGLRGEVIHISPPKAYTLGLRGEVRKVSPPKRMDMRATRNISHIWTRSNTAWRGMEGAQAGLAAYCKRR
jgi:hypothetical protein